jgi:hypothetical protein
MLPSYRTCYLPIGIVAILPHASVGPAQIQCVGHARKQLQISIHNALDWLKCLVLGYTVSNTCEDTIQKRERQFIRFLNARQHQHFLTVFFMSFVFELSPNLRWIEILWCVFISTDWSFQKVLGLGFVKIKTEKRQPLSFFSLFFEKRDAPSDRKSQPFLWAAHFSHFESANSCLESCSFNNPLLASFYNMISVTQER